MGKNKNKGGRNAFYFFMLDFQKQQGRSFKSMAEVAHEAGAHWQRMSPQQKTKYEEMARNVKGQATKMATTGESLDELLREEKEKAEKESSIKKEIDNTLRRCANTNTIAAKNFHIMHMNEFCYWDRGNRHLPAEIALGKFSLRNGIVKDNVYHSFTYPGKLPLGYLAKVNLKSEETHQLPYAEEKNNIEEVLMKLIDKLTEDADDSDEIPPIYVSEKQALMIENVLGWMCEDFGQPNIFRLYSLEYLFYSLRNSISPTGTKIWPTPSLSVMQLEKDVYDFCTGIACGYHEIGDIPQQCSLSHIIRWVYVICDNCLVDLDVTVIKGQHVPINALIKDDDLASRPSSVAQSRSSHFQEPDVASEISTIVDESEIGSYHGFDSDSQIADDDMEWRRPRRHKSNRNANLSQVSDTAAGLSQTSQTSSNSEYISARRPTSQSSASSGVAGASNFIRRGRGRGILLTRPPV